MFFHSKLGFDKQIKIIFDKSSKSIGLICKLRNILTRPSPWQICKSLVRPYLDYSETIYDKAFIVSFQQKLKSIQYNVALATTWTIRGICRKNLILSQVSNHFKIYYFYYVTLSHLNTSVIYWLALPEDMIQECDQHSFNNS